MNSRPRRILTTIASMTALLLALGSGCGGNKESKQPVEPAQAAPAADQPETRTTAPAQPRGTPPAAGERGTPPAAGERGTPPAAGERGMPPAAGERGKAAPGGSMPGGPMAGGPMMHRMMQSCPVMVEGVNVEATDTESGVAMTFTTTTGDVEELRERVRNMAEMYNLHHRRGGLMWHRMGGGPGAGPEAGMGRGHGMHHRGRGQGLGPMPAAAAAVETVDNGARLVLTPRDPARLEALRAHVRMHTERMRTHECPYLMQQPGAQPGPPSQE